MSRSARMRWTTAAALAGGPCLAFSQVPDILSTLDAGTRAMGLGGAVSSTDVTPHAALLNPAGLGYISSPTGAITFRNLPETESFAQGAYASPSLDVDRKYGRTGFTSLGFALPVGRGTFGFNYSMAGYQLDERSAAFLSSGGDFFVNYRAFTRAQTDLFTLSYGQDNGGFAWGLGFILAQQYLRATEDYQVFSGLTQTGVVSASASGNARGYGAVAGVQAPVGASGMIGASIRTPISLRDNDQVTGLYSRIPGRASLGYSGKRGFGGTSQDYLIYALQADYHFGGDKRLPFQRMDRLGWGVGFEYNLNRGGSRWPLRLGYQALASQGLGYSDRNALTFGLGWRPENGRFGIDLNFLRDSKGGPTDAALGITYRFGN